MNATKRFCSIVTGVVLVLAALMLVAFVGVRLFGLTPYAVLSGSMEPEYPTGSLIYVRDVDPADVAVGDAITFELESGTLVTHEVYEIDSDARAFRTQGIANIDAGGIVHDALPVPFERVIGARLSSASPTWGISTNSSPAPRGCSPSARALLFS